MVKKICFRICSVELEEEGEEEEYLNILIKLFFPRPQKCFYLFNLHASMSKLF